MIARLPRHCTPPKTITAPEKCERGAAMRALSDQRLAYFRQSAATVAGRRAEYDPSDPQDLLDADGNPLSYAALSGGW